MDRMRRQALIDEFMEEVEEIAKEMDDGTLPLEDLVQEGYVGLMKGLEALDTEESDEEAAYGGLSVSETIRNSIRDAIEEAVENQNRLRRDDDRLVRQVELLDRSIDRLTGELGTKPNIDELANDMKVSQDTVLGILKLTGDEMTDEELIPPSGGSSGSFEVEDL